MKRIKNIIKDFFEFFIAFCLMILFLLNIKQMLKGLKKIFKEEKSASISIILGILLIYSILIYIVIEGILFIINY
jgi:hypothetical protein